MRQTSPPSHYGHVRLEIEPYQGAHEFLLVWAVREGIQNVALNNAGEWGPLTGIQVTIIRNALERMPTAPVPERREEQSSAEEEQSSAETDAEEKP